MDMEEPCHVNSGQAISYTGFLITQRAGALNPGFVQVPLWYGGEGDLAHRSK